MRCFSASTRVATCVLVALGLLGGMAATAQALPNGWAMGGKKEPWPEPEIGSFKTQIRVGYAILECERDRRPIHGAWVYEKCKVIAWIINPNNKATGQACTTRGAAVGEIVVGTPKESFAAISGNNTEHPVVGLEFALKKFSFECDNVKFEGKGGVIGEVTPIRTPTKEYTAVFGEKEGHQAVTSFEGGKTTQLEFKATEGKTKTKWEPGTFESTETLVTEKATELRSDAEWKQKEKEEKKKK